MRKVKTVRRVRTELWENFREWRKLIEGSSSNSQNKMDDKIQ